MVEKKLMDIINISLVFISLILFINLFGFEFTPVGQAFFDAADPSESTCFVEWDGEYAQMNQAYCCHDVQKQFSCENNQQIIQDQKTDISCQSGEGRVLKNHLNDKSFRECRGLSTWQRR